MPHHLILARSEPTANALGAWLELLGEKPLVLDDDPRCIVWPESIDHTTLIDAYDALCERIKETARAGMDTISLNRVTVLVDSVDLSDTLFFVKLYLLWNRFTSKAYTWFGFPGGYR
uniref:Uncharacterized protein n=1 Tax=Candidatus Kentrum sp. MB TaxID=2138164 RepID=A0A450XWS6_9GAMM|nr:MAG: hypothetical protein BECKMB1821G_GA0114241_11791 [Candidatus Kentron sp. MB]VFK35343.1 MAG: hypothetical protein BECKMB1821I_GA0114274_11131 [Candidatus Kentron sp. MB]VFK77233.1 MAG: hypothetical protein BECKMB1821H_GA0114242_11131 [Candidatus Kentron sp. MB]